MSFTSTIHSQFSNTAAAQDAIDRYFYREKFNGANFELMADTDNPNRFTARDIVAVSTLSVDVPAAVSIWLLLGDGGRQTSDLLKQVPPDLDIWDAAEHLAKGKPLWQLWDILMEQHNIGITKCSKLLAAKRPRLVPIWDSVVDKVFGKSDDHWRDMRLALSSAEDRALIAEATANAPNHVSLLRRLDVVIWMLNR
jgi:hypothetical protein